MEGDERIRFQLPRNKKMATVINPGRAMGKHDVPEGGRIRMRRRGGRIRGGCRGRDLKKPVRTKGPQKGNPNARYTREQTLGGLSEEMEGFSSRKRGGTMASWRGDHQAGEEEVENKIGFGEGEFESRETAS